MNRISKILVIVDPSTRGRRSAVDKAALLAGRSNASVELLVCQTASALNDELPPNVRRLHPSNTELLDLLDELASPMRGQGTEVALRIIYGKSLHDALLDYLRRSDADLVIKDTHQHSFARRTFAGNTEWHLVRNCPMPLLMANNKPWGQPPTILSAVDLHQCNPRAALLNRHILDFAASLTGCLTGDLHIVHSYIPTAFAAMVRAGRQSMPREYSEAVQVEKSFRYCQIEHLGSAYGVSPQHLHVEMGTPRDCLKQAVEKYHTDLVVMGASSHGWQRMVIGSTDSTLLESLQCDVLIVGPLELTRSAAF
ncbi:MAG: universal stress protein [Steroidobacteraceae bacterium]